MFAALVGILFRIAQPFFFALIDVFNVSALRKLVTYTTIMTLFVGVFLLVELSIERIKIDCPDFIAIPLSWVVPDNLNLCVTTYIAAGMLITIYRYKVKLAKIFAI